MAKEKVSNSRNFISVILILLFCAGLLFGSVMAKQMSKEQSDELYESTNSAFVIASDGSMNHGEIFKLGVINNSIWVITIWLAGFSIFLGPLILASLSFKGFSIGFCCGYFIRIYGFKGFLFTLISIIPQNLIYVCALLLIGSMAASNSLSRYAYKRNYDLKRALNKKYFLYLFLAEIIIVLGAVLEGLLSGAGLPILM